MKRGIYRAWWNDWEDLFFYPGSGDRYHMLPRDRDDFENGTNFTKDDLPLIAFAAFTDMEEPHMDQFSGLTYADGQVLWDPDREECRVILRGPDAMLNPADYTEEPLDLEENWFTV